MGYDRNLRMRRLNGVDEAALVALNGGVVPKVPASSCPRSPRRTAAPRAGSMTLTSPTTAGWGAVGAPNPIAGHRGGRCSRCAP